jgi:predicted methyltransferase
MIGGGALAFSQGLAACKGRVEAPGPASATPVSGAAPMTMETAAAGDWRSPEDKARDAWRHPAQTLEFFGVHPGAEVVEFWPGAGWYTDIIAPYLAANGGMLYAADVDPSTPAGQAMVDAYRRKLEAKPGLYGKVNITAFGPKSGPVAPAGSADVALFMRNLHDWMAGGFAEKAFHDAYQALKPRGVLGIEQHRAAPGGVQDVLAKDGYVMESYVKDMAQEAGFRFDKASEINANPKDHRSYPFGVWTLPPSLRSAPPGKPPNPDFDQAKYRAIGESDRMTLRFIKPG